MSEIKPTLLIDTASNVPLKTAVDLITTKWAGLNKPAIGMTGVGTELAVLETLADMGLTVRRMPLDEFQQVSNQEGVTILRLGE